MRGIKIRRGTLVLRPIGWVLAGSVGDVVTGSALIAAALSMRGLWWVGFLPGAYLAVDGLVRLRVAVVATESTVCLRNRWRTHSIPLDEVQAVRAETVHWLFRQPAYFMTRSDWSGRDWVVGTVAATSGETYECDALISVPGSDDERQLDPTPTEMKVATLRRWIEAQRSAQML